MVYRNQLPTRRQLLHLAGKVSFPADYDDIKDVATQFSFPASVLDFLSLFTENEEFPSRSDFIARCEELEILIEEKRQTPRESPRNPQE